MTKQQFEKLWEAGRDVEMDFVQVERNYHSFPEAITGYHTEGVFCGIHFSFEDINTFALDHTVCMFSLDTVDEVAISRRKDAHGQFAYAVKMIGDDVFPVQEVENGREYRAIGTRCIIRKIQL